MKINWRRDLTIFLIYSFKMVDTYGEICLKISKFFKMVEIFHFFQHETFVYWKSPTV